jgi:transcription initiation factor TFIID subunit 2
LLFQELDGYYTHTVQIDSDVSKHDIQCHSKGRKQKRKKVPISTGEELEIDLSSMDPDSPIMWIRFVYEVSINNKQNPRVDPMMQLIRRVNINQPVIFRSPIKLSIYLAASMGVYA